MIACRAIPILVVMCLTACSWLSPSEQRVHARLAATDGLERVDVDLPGVLEVRADHHIGSYDALLIPRPSLGYERQSLRLTREAERVLLTLLRDSIVEASLAAAVPVVDEPARCTMEIDLRVAGFDVQVDHDSPQLAKLTLVMEFRDSLTRKLLLRYAADDRVPSPTGDETHDDRIRRGLDRIVADMNIGGPFRASGFANDTVLPGCKGTLAARGRAAAQATP